MKYYSTRNFELQYNFRTAVLKGLADDGGLIVPSKLPELNSSDFKSFNEFIIFLLHQFMKEEISIDDLSDLFFDAINFETTITELCDNISVLELFNGPTLAFKDYGARFMSRIMGHFVKNESKKINILVATSGDTGSAVASGFHGVEGINVFILYPSGKVSLLQEKQLTTYDKNITALEIDGTFDDCQKLVKQAFSDNELNQRLNLSSANSINIARLLPQMIYYWWSSFNYNANLSFVVPSGNLGNLTAGLYSKKIGNKVNKFVSALNINHVFWKYLNSGKFIPETSIKTLSNAMDVGNPSNIERIINLYSGKINFIKDDIKSFYFNDNKTKEAIKEVYEKYNYIIDPHGAVGYLAAKEYLAENTDEKLVILETAHPAKFKDTIDGVLNINLELPNNLKQIVSKEKKSVNLKNDYESLKSYLLSTN